MVSSASLERILLNFLITPIYLFALVIFSLTWWSKFNFSSKWIHKCFWMEHLLPGTLLKRTGGWGSLWLLREKTTSWACLEKSGLKDVFHWYAHFDIFNKSLFNCIADTLTSSTTKNMDESLAKTFTVEEMSLLRYLYK